MGDGVRRMRRCAILIGGLCGGFCLLWFLCMQMALAYHAEHTVLSVAPTVQIQLEQYLQFPFKIPGTTLIAEQIVSFDGLFTEDGGSSDVTDVAAILLYNYGECGILDAQVVLQAGQLEFVFVADTLPAGQRLLVPEQTGKEYGPEMFSSCSGWQREDKADWLNKDVISLTFPGMGEVLVTNLTDRKLTGIQLQYKTYYPDAPFYVGGKTYTYCIEMLEPGENIRIYPQNYALGYSDFVRILIGQT